MIYAIGEIILVVIGILIALGINNWNDQNNLTNKETSLLIEMKSNLESDLEGLKWDINKNEKLLKANQMVLKSLNSGVYHDSLNLYYTWIKGNTVFVKNTSAFKNLESFGLDIIKNDSLRIKITNLYSTRYEYIRYIEQVRDEKFQYEQIIPQITKHLRLSSQNLYEPINFDALSKNNEFRSVITLNCDLRNYIITTYKDIEKMVTELIDAIELELKDLNK
ncbi:hypothetical protein GCM10023330_14690 [Litoribaculum gwangyangense]|uniref:Uncharacterized protein n=2 Tax=Litoribaculum gwangyangense TaxID=1130722 RepID=A0ABP9CHA9_9FLAO